MNKYGTILIVDDNASILTAMHYLLDDTFERVLTTIQPEEILKLMAQQPVDLVLLDMNFTLGVNNGNEGLFWLRTIRKQHPQAPVVLLTAYADVNLAVKGLKNGAADFITKPWDNGVLLDRIETAIKINNASPAAQPIQSSPIVGTSLSGILTTVARVAPTNAPVLITGESGTGKELIAEAIHRQSQRANGPFVKVNLGGISTSLFESEMFGHKKGSFTDAKADRIGRFEMASGGTIFLDEIGELSLASQVKLLRVLQDQTYEVLGDSQTRRTDVRVVCATNADLRTMVEEHTFREDLFYRINIINLHLPPLRDRREDIPLLVNHFLRMACEANRLPSVTVSTEAIGYLQTLPFPGNIRELKNLVERALLMKNPEAGLLGVEDFAVNTRQQEGTSCTDAKRSLSSMERSAIAACIAKHNGNLSLVAKELGISRGALYRKIEKHGL